MTPRLTRRALLAAAAASTATLAGCRLRPWAGAKGNSPMNILLISADDLGPHIGCMGDRTVPTPNLDALAASGARLDTAWVTQASCAPSRGSYFTGLYPHENGQVGLSHLGYHLNPGVVHFPALLKGAGYFTGTIGKVHTEPEESFVFDVDKRGFIVPSRDVKAVAAHAREFLDARPAGRPFFLMVNVFDPHRPYEGVDQVNGLPEKPLRAGDVAPFPFLAGVESPQLLADMATYYNGVSRVDWCVGALMQELAGRGLEDDTLVIFLGDHGPPFTRGKTTCYEAGLHVPLIVRWPGAPAGVASRELVSTVDLFPTILEAAGLEPPPGRHDARSLRPLLLGRDVAWRDGMAAEYTAHRPYDFFPRRAWRDQRWKLIHNLLPGRENPVRGIDDCPAWAAAHATGGPTVLNEALGVASNAGWAASAGSTARAVYERYDHPPEFELFDLEADPHEFTNLAGLPPHAAVEQRLRAALLAWRQSTADPLLDGAELASIAARHDEIRGRWLANPDVWPHWEG